MELVQVSVHNLCSIDDPILSNYGKMRDLCHDFSYDFIGGHAYGIISDCGAGGWGLSYALSGLGSILSGEAKLNNTLLNQEMLKALSCYVGEDTQPTNIFGKKSSSVKKQLLRGSRLIEGQLELDSIIHQFGLPIEKLDNLIKHIGNDRWNATAAIGFAQNKKIYCFPWLNKDWIHKLRPRLERILEVIKNDGGIVIIPTSRPENLLDMVDKCVFL
ncbi:hypothetical protein [Paenibacillus sp. SYP-B3998]|uniref:hypothetical protein n=1 Tax=Paenibacillus sp. SYP-B3998 TaxID=2678564 RepID=UPI0013D30BAF|nr:hypothetical protein [Paenibacillus sp. SYP-B3998]